MDCLRDWMPAWLNCTIKQNWPFLPTTKRSTICRVQVHNRFRNIFLTFLTGRRSVASHCSYISTLLEHDPCVDRWSTAHHVNLCLLKLLIWRQASSPQNIIIICSATRNWSVLQVTVMTTWLEEYWQIITLSVTAS